MHGYIYANKQNDFEDDHRMIGRLVFYMTLNCCGLKSNREITKKYRCHCCFSPWTLFSLKPNHSMRNMYGIHVWKYVKKSNNLQPWPSKWYPQNSVNCIIGIDDNMLKLNPNFIMYELYISLNYELILTSVYSSVKWE